ncbi:MAG: hypothetical protein L0241_13535 [Planctomycetia bacterium]|nr:hypothetical protein [Planctomycetia bacterium]
MNPNTANMPIPVLNATPPMPTAWDTLRARLMFVLAFVYLIGVAGLIHRAPSKSVTQWELDAMYVGLVALWPIFAVEALWSLWRRDRSKRTKPVLLRAILVMFMPPWRLALTDSRTNLIWIPRLGWQSPGKELFKRLERAFGVPMLLFAFMILPILLLEYLRGDLVRDTHALTLALDIGIAVVWLAFATEFVLKASAHPKPFQFAQDRWLDVAIVVLPMLEFVLTRWVDIAPLARLLRAGRALSPEQIARMQRLYRLQGVATKAWHALLLLEGVRRLLGNTPEKRLAKLEEHIEDLEEQLKETRHEADEMRALIAEKEAAEAQKVQGTPQPVSETVQE